MKVSLSAIALLLALQAGSAHACGHCVEDKVAAVYDYAVVTRARAQRHHVAFFALDGTVMQSDVIKREIESTVRGIKGVDKDSVRVSLELASLSFSFDPDRASFDSLQKSLEKKLTPWKIAPLELKFMDGPALARTADRR